MPVRWGLLATGNIAHNFAAGVEASTLGELQAVGSRTQDGAQVFMQHHPTIRSAHGSYEALLADADVDAIYIATPHPEHAAWAIRALRAGKAVLCEKPLALNHAEAMAIIAEAERQQLFLMEAFMYRTLPQTQQLLDLIAQDAIGEIRHINAEFGFHAPFNPESRLFANQLAGGGMMDVGCYPLSLTRLLAGEPVSISGAGRVGTSNVDEWASALMTFENDVTAQISTAVRVNLKNHATIYGSKGRIEIPTPWNPGKEGPWSFRIISNDGSVAGNRRRSCH